MPSRFPRTTLPAALVLTLAGTMLAGCGGVSAGRPDPQYETNDPRERRIRQSGSIFGEDGLVFGGRDRDEQAATGIGVNSFLWRASLDTVSFLPVTSADPFGGVILTDWHSTPEAPNERFKLNVYILDRQLRADGIRVAVFRQVFDPRAGWVDAPVGPGTATALENTILTRARELRVASTAS